MPVNIDGTDITSATIDGTEVKEITVDGDVVFSAIPDSVVYDFESGDTSRWDDVPANFSVYETIVYDGDFSAFCLDDLSSTYQARVKVDGYDGGRQPSEFEFFWNESKYSSGGGIRLFNSNGNVEVGLATNNPQWDIDDANGVEQVYTGDGYDRWIRFSITFDWNSASFDLDFEDLQSGSRYQESNRPLKKGRDIEVAQIENYSSKTWQDGGVIDMWFDNITFKK